MANLFDFSHFPEVETERLHLRKMTPADVSALLKHFGNPEVVKYMNMQVMTSSEQADEWLDLMDSFFSARDGLRWAVILKGDKQFIGTAGLFNWNREGRYIEIVYDISQAYWGRGYGTEVIKAMLDFGFHRMRLNRIEAEVLSGNTAAMRVLEKAGFQQEGSLRERVYKADQYHDVHLFAMLREDFLAHAG